MITDDIDDVIKQGIAEYCEDEIDRCMNTLQKEDCVSSEFKQKMEQFIEKEHKKFIWKRFIKRISCLLIPIAIISCVISFNGNVGADCMDFIRNYFTQGLKSYHDSNIEPDNTGEVAGDEIIGFELTYIPDGYKLVRVEENKYEKKCYYKKNDTELLFHYYMFAYSWQGIDYENRAYETILIDDKKCDYYKKMTDKEGSMLVWKKDDYICKIFICGRNDDLPNEELFNIVKGVKNIYKEKGE